MMRRTCLYLVSLGAAIALAGCDDSSLDPAPPGSKLNAETIATRDTPPELQFKGTLAGQPVHLLMHKCKVYKVEPGAGENVKWTLVLEGDSSAADRLRSAIADREQGRGDRVYWKAGVWSGRVLHGDAGVSLQGWGELEAALSVGLLFTEPSEAGRLLPLGY